MKEARENQRDVLLVDGDAARRRQTGEALQSVYHVTAALDGEMAVELLHGRQDFAAVVVQCRLYDFSGFDLIRYLHTNRALSAIPIVAIGEPEDEMKALSLGAAGFVRSPGDPRLICCQVQNLVNLIWSDRERDVLTGALLLDPFLKQAQQKLEESAKGGRSPRWAVAFLNVSRFKTFNDLFGRAAGDQLLRNLAARLMQGRGVEFVGRTGADRFFVLCRRDELDLNAVAFMRSRTRRVPSGRSATAPSWRRRRPPAAATTAWRSTTSSSAATCGGSRAFPPRCTTRWRAGSFRSISSRSSAFPATVQCRQRRWCAGSIRSTA